jgi:hypothetical protein
MILIVNSDYFPEQLFPIYLCNEDAFCFLRGTVRSECLILFRCTSLSSRLLSRNVKIKIYKTIILPVVLYGCGTLSLTVRDEHRLRVFENRVIRRIFGPKRDEVTGGWRKLHNEELRGLYSSPSIVRAIKARRMRWAGHVARIGEVRGAYNTLVPKSEGRRPLGRPRCRWEDNIKMDLREQGLGMWIGFIGLRIGTGGGLL